MERVEQYRQSIRQVLTSHATFESSNSGIESQLVFDTEHDH
ncbi:MAG: element excision factor XisI family protein, partial [Nostoc sp.]